MRCRTVRSFLVTLAAVLTQLVVPSLARAQTAAVRPACRHPVTAADATYDFVMQSLTPADSIQGTAGEVSLLDQRIAHAMRGSIGGSDQALPRIDSLGYAEANGVLPIAIVVHRDAPTTWEREPAADSASARMAGLYGLLFHSMTPADLRITWPAVARGDSLVLQLSLHAITRGRPDFFQVTNTSMLVFAARHPADAEAPPIFEQEGRFIPSYKVMERGVAWRVAMQATIDDEGRVEKSTVHDIRAMASTSDSSHFEYYYSKIVDAARQAMLDSRFVPAHRDGCNVEQIVRQAYYVNPTGYR